MSKVMGTTGLSALLERLAGEYGAKASIYDIPERAFREAFELEDASPGLETIGGRASLPVGPAAGPNSQIAPALVAAYLAGARVFELKTVQENDALDIEKPCIDARDEGYNVEWSTELTLDEARGEYVRGWVAVNLLAALFSPRPRDFVFNMSVGYTLDGIKGRKVDAFIEGMRSPALAPGWDDAMRELEAFVRGAAFAAAFGRSARGKALDLLAAFPDRPVASVTLSTMHGCPPEEIERIGEYLICAKGLDAYVKLNPTLLGYDAARVILDATGWRGIRLQRASFEHDLQFARAIDLVRSLGAKAAASGRRFGIKLSNTLANRNDGGYLPGAERYMSGRALFPLTARLAAELAGALPEFSDRFSYCGGASALNAGELVAAGLGPITVATDILKPGGYLRLGQAARAAAAAIPGSPSRPDAAALRRLADAALERPEYRAGWKSGEASIRRPLPAIDCFAAPCVEACPVGQLAPEYIRQAAAGSTQRALGTILDDNPLPFITGTLCDHVCQEACCRNDYEGSVEIRAVKLACAKAASIPASRPPRAPAAPKAAAIGAGPAGLAFAHHLALAGVPVVVFDEAPGPGGVPANVIPRFRIPRADIAADIDRIRALGAEFRFGERIESAAELAARGFSAAFACVGASVPRELPLQGDGVRVVDALDFLERTAGLGEPGGAAAASAFAGARNVVIAGGGNTAMDAARVAVRLPGVAKVTIAYRRSRDEMPADREELANALSEGAELRELCLPERAVPAGAGGSPESSLVLRLMELGERDSSGRRSPVPTERAETIPCDLLVAAVGESPDRSLLESLGLACGRDGRPVVDPETQAATPLPGRAPASLALYAGGDAARGPASIIAAEADGRRAAYAVLRAAGIEPPARDRLPPVPDPAKLAARGKLLSPLSPEDPLFVAREAERCLSCDSACLRCVEVCPNRANTAVPVQGGPFRQSIQILHVDYLCNECGNCASFCPWEGEPYRGKLTLFRDRASLEASPNAGFCLAPAAGAPQRDAPQRGEPRIVALRAIYGGPALGLEAAAAEPGAEAVMALARAVARGHAYLAGGAR